MLAAVSFGIVRDQVALGLQPGGELHCDRDRTKRRLEAPASPQAGATRGAEPPGVVRCDDHYDIGKLEPAEYFGGAPARVDQPGMRHHGRASRPGFSLHLGQVVFHHPAQVFRVVGIEVSGYRGWSNIRLHYAILTGKRLGPQVPAGPSNTPAHAIPHPRQQPSSVRFHSPSTYQSRAIRSDPHPWQYVLPPA